MAIRKVPKLDVTAAYRVGRKNLTVGSRLYKPGSILPAGSLDKRRLRIFLEYGYLVSAEEGSAPTEAPRSLKKGGPAPPPIKRDAPQ